jgi:3alpha(or 20beta)-hydroxysteroid dehydrogenase
MLEEKVAIITGAARGMGAAEARLFAAEGARVVLTDIDTAGAEIAEEIGEPAMFVQHDVCRCRGWERVVNQAVERHGRVDVLLNSAAVSRPALPGPQADRRRRAVRCVRLHLLAGHSPAGS